MCDDRVPMGIYARTVAKPASVISKAKQGHSYGPNLHSVMRRFSEENVTERTIYGVTQSAIF